MVKTHLQITHLQINEDTGIKSKKPSLALDKELFEPPVEAEDKLDDPKKFQAIIGGLLFINRMTRPDISIQVNLLGRRASNPSQSNLHTVQTTLKYLWLTRFEEVILHKLKEINLVAYADTSYGGEGSRLQGGGLLTLGNQPIEWNSRRQDVVTLSITKAKYIADCEAAKHLSWALQFLKELDIEMSTPTLTTDSEGAYHLSKTSKFLRHSQHIEHRYHYIWQQVQRDLLNIKTILGKDNPADYLTKLTHMSSIRSWKQSWISTVRKDGT